MRKYWTNLFRYRIAPSLLQATKRNTPVRPKLKEKQLLTRQLEMTVVQFVGMVRVLVQESWIHQRS